ncbi:ead/Ea22-like family protein [Klebsiella pneumoniae]|uniref:ead/Ea22-like family protein n=1 Tax=Klebsiella pneumoniae TaxID=573 RepID=UPI0019512CBF|nr:ead/Ea22-like family protein [Klebsiella pneumoniae]MBM6485355.1 ead/Ea22-like family protein [Klebsiella pneumoniae]MBS2925261.1 ead/Ea22-like family protein [Klebsiella pneumoniae]HBX2484202.1 ead/Ea22-like family protein [Klebsiella pneumoniae]HBX2813645.1 ead/Ea22-like family protein [Klebsiella pneumoniae]
MTDITELAQSLKAAAEKATPGEWVYFPKNTSIEYDVGSDESQGSILYVDSGDFTQVQTDRNGEFIALANPANILALVEALEKAQTERDEFRNRLKLERSILEDADKRIAELESRTVKLPDLRQIVSGDRYVWSDGVYNYSQDVKVALAAAGIKVEAE